MLCAFVQIHVWRCTETEHHCFCCTGRDAGVETERLAANRLARGSAIVINTAALKRVVLSRRVTGGEVHADRSSDACRLARSTGERRPAAITAKVS